MNDIKTKRITVGFNIVMFIYISIAFAVEYLSTPETLTKAPWELLFKNSPMISIALALITVLILLITGAYLIKIFWNRFISDVFKVRAITYDESLALVLIITVISA